MPLNAVSETYRAIRYNWRTLAAFVVAVVISFTPAIYSAGLIYGPDAEGPAVASIEIEAAHCDGSDAMVTLYVAKHHGVYEDMKFLALAHTNAGAPASIEMAWQDASGLGPRRKENRPTGPLLIGPLRVVGLCGLPFYVHTYHASDYGWWVFRSRFGPFEAAQ